MSCLLWQGHATAVLAPLLASNQRARPARLNMAASSCRVPSPLACMHGHTRSTPPTDESVAHLVRMLGVANTLQDREAAVHELWMLAEDGKDKVDEILSCPEALHLVVALVASECPGASEAAAGLLAEVSAIHSYGTVLAQAGAVQEITSLLARRRPPHEVKYQAAKVLVNLAAEPGLRDAVANPELLPVVLLMLESGHEGEQAAAAGIVANLSLSESIRMLLLEAGAVPKLATIVKADLQKVSKLARLEARNALLRLSKHPKGKKAALEEGLMFVPLVGADAYKSLKAIDSSAAKVTGPEEIVEHPIGPQESPFGAGDVLLGLRVTDAHNVDDVTRLAMEGRSRLNFLKRLNLIEPVAGRSKEQAEAQKMMVLPWWDAIPRLVLILGLEDRAYAMLGAEAVAEVAITEDYRRKLAKAGAISHLIYILESGDERAMEAAAGALESLSVSKKVGKALNAFGAVPALTSVLKAPGVPDSLQEKVVGALQHLSQTLVEVEILVRAGNVAGVLDIVNSEDATSETKFEAESVLKELVSLKADPRDKIVDAGGVPPLIQLVSRGSFAIKHKAAAVLENVATREVHATNIADSGADLALKSLLQLETLANGVCESDGSEWLAVCAACRLLGTLVDWPSSRERLDLSSYIEPMLEITKLESCPVWVKDWISGCVLKMAKYARTSSSPSKQVINDTIPRLVEEIEDGSWAAVGQLRELMSCGIPEYASTVAKAGGVERVLKLLESATDVDSREAALSIIYSVSMAGEADGHALVRSIGVVERMVREEEGAGWKLALELLKQIRRACVC